MGFLETNSQKNSRFCRFHGKFGTNFAEIRSLKKPIPRKFCKQIMLESNQFCTDFTNVLNETKWQSLAILFWGGGGKWWALAFVITTTTETSTTYKCNCFKTDNFVPETPTCSSPLDLVLSRRSAPMAKLFISCTGQCPVFCNNYLRTRGSFGTFSCCRDKVSK